MMLSKQDAYDMFMNSLNDKTFTLKCSRSKINHRIANIVSEIVHMPIFAACKTN